MNDRTAVNTGASSGIGKETARAPLAVVIAPGDYSNRGSFISPPQRQTKNPA